MSEWISIGSAAPDGADLEAGPVVGERVRPRRVAEAGGDQERRAGGVAVVDVPDLRQVQLIPAVRAVAADRVALVQVLDPVAERVGGQGQLPGEYLRRVGRDR